MADNKDSQNPDKATVRVNMTAQLAADVCDLWQEHLTALATDPRSKAELARMLEPQRQALGKLFADYNAMMQHERVGKVGSNPPSHASASTFTNPFAPHDDDRSGRTSASSQPTFDEAPPRATAAAAPSDDSALRLAQLAHRVAALEERLARVEQRKRRNSGKPQA